MRPNKTATRTTLALGAAAMLAITPATPTLALDLHPPAMSFEDERQQAISQHRQILSQFGGEYDDAELSAYVTRVGEKVAKSSEMPDNPFVFTVLNTPMVNAFTVGGGYVYVTRGILGTMNNEAELAALLGHEIAHVTGRHTSRRITRLRQDRLASVGVGLVTGSWTAFGLAEILGATLRTSYSRGQEAESDRLGVENLVRAGYDPYAMADMLGSLGRTVELQGTIAEAEGQKPGFRVPAWLQDHPQIPDRIRDTTEQAEQTGIARGEMPVNRDAYLDVIDGVMWGDDPKLGVVKDGRFSHPELRVGFDIPEGFTTQNTQFALVAVDEEAGEMMLFSGSDWPADQSLEEYAISTWYSVTRGSVGGLESAEPVTINGIPALIATKTISNFLVTANIVMVAYRLDSEKVYSLSFIVTDELSDEKIAEFRAVGESFRRLTDAEVAAIKPVRVQVRTAGVGATAETMAADMAYDTFKTERLTALNGLTDAIGEGDRVKVLIESE